MRSKLLVVVVVLACAGGLIWYTSRDTRTPEERAEALWTQAIDLIKRGKFKDAIKCMQDCIKLPDQKTAANYSILAHCYHYDGQYQNALRQYEKALSLEPDRAPTRVAYAGCLLKAIDDKQEAWRRADAELAKIGERHRQHPTVVYNLACVYAENGRPQEALHYLEYAIRTEPTAKDEAKTDPSFDAIRDMEPFKRLVE